jgi:hypothetical protein
MENEIILAPFRHDKIVKWNSLFLPRLRGPVRAEIRCRQPGGLERAKDSE